MFDQPTCDQNATNATTLRINSRPTNDKLTTFSITSMRILRSKIRFDKKSENRHERRYFLLVRS